MLAEWRYASPMADPLIDLATVPPIPLHPAVLAARQPLAGAVAALLTVADTSLDDPWRWRATDPEDVELRYGLYRIHERLETAIGTIAVGRAGRAESIGPAVPPLAAMAAARWELRGALAPLGQAAWDADPGGGEWTIRQTFGHIVSGQRSYGWYNAWYLKEGVVGVETVRPSEDVLPPEPTDEEEAAGSPALAQARLDDVVDANIVAGGRPRRGSHGRERPVGRAAGDDRLPARALRLAHPRAHVQVDKTLAMLGRQPSEVERLVRLILATYGRLEGQLVGRRPDDLERPSRQGRARSRSWPPR